jgi:hypothetical protein
LPPCGRSRSTGSSCLPSRSGATSSPGTPRAVEKGRGLRVRSMYAATAGSMPVLPFDSGTVDGGQEAHVEAGPCRAACRTCTNEVAEMTMPRCPGRRRRSSHEGRSSGPVITECRRRRRRRRGPPSASALSLGSASSEGLPAASGCGRGSREAADERLLEASRKSRRARHCRAAAPGSRETAPRSRGCGRPGRSRPGLPLTWSIRGSTGSSGGCRQKYPCPRHLLTQLLPEPEGP